MTEHGAAQLLKDLPSQEQSQTPIVKKVNLNDLLAALNDRDAQAFRTLIKFLQFRLLSACLPLAQDQPKASARSFQAHPLQNSRKTSSPSHRPVLAFINTA